MKVPSPKSSLRLEDYATFQYMLAPPFTAAAICNEIESFVFYNEPHDPQRKDDYTVMVQGYINVLNYYGCCLAVLPSHLLGMSQWISSEDFVKDASNKKQGRGDSPKILRRFRYSYYFGLLQVDTRHMQLEEKYAASPSSFRLVEHMDISPWAWVIAEAVFMGIFAAIIWSIQRLLILFSDAPMVGDDPSFPWTNFAIVVVAFNLFGLSFRGNYRP